MEAQDTLIQYDSIQYVESNIDSLRIDSISVDSLINDLLFKSIADEPFREKIDHQPFVADWAVVLMIIAFALLAWVKTTSLPYLVSLIQSSVNRHTAARLFREKSSNIIHPSFRLNTLFYLSLSAFIIHFKQFFPSFFDLSEIMLFLVTLGVVFLFVNIKRVLYLFSGFLFNTQNETREFIFYMMSGCRIMGIFMLPVSTIMFFTEGFFDVILAFIGLLIISFISVISLFRGFRIIAQKEFSLYYLILYLCSLEILPLLLVWRVLR